ncbi:MAG: hypothetical protein NG747_09390 [Candidatus Brocadia sp.]|nr:hypothetical protein [Candidatus Brocadia sp.]
MACGQAFVWYNGKTHTPQEYLGALLDTAATTALTTLGATGVAHLFIGGPVSSPDQCRHSMSSSFFLLEKKAKKSLKIRDYKAIAQGTFFALRF